VRAQGDRLTYPDGIWDRLLLEVTT
jgi:hypothetical protein